MAGSAEDQRKARKITDQERAKIRDVMARAAEVEREETRRKERLRQPLEGQLNKWTNVVKGWQPRWFYLDPTASILYYYVSEDKRKGPPRGSILLEGAVVSPSDDDSQTFSIHPTNGDTFKLRGANAKERQSWVTKLRQVVENLKPNYDSQKGGLTSGSMSGPSFGSSQSDGARTRKTSIKDRLMTSLHRSSSVSMPRTSSTGSQSNSHSMSRKVYQAESGRRLPETSPLVGIGDVLELTESHQESLLHQLETIAEKIPEINPYSDPDILLMKATSEVALATLHSCFKLLAVQARQSASLGRDQTSSVNSLLPGSTIEWIPASSNNSSPSQNELRGENESMEVDQPEETLSDETLYGVDSTPLDIERDKERKSAVLSLLSQLKLGMDLTRVTAPVSILERRSLLEACADFLSHPEMFSSISDGLSSEDRMIRTTKFFLASFCCGQINMSARKPYNPVLGEFFECSWPPSQTPSDSRGAPVKFTAEQVSHNPPISAFYSDSPSKHMQLNGYVWTKAKFLGMGVEVQLDGEVCLSAIDHGEDYLFTLPTIYVRSILTHPWVELGGQVRIICKKSGYQATVNFHPKPQYEGKANSVSGEIRQMSSTVPVCTLSGQWTGDITMSFEDDQEPLTFNAAGSPRVKKTVKPVSQQGDYESRRIWRKVTLALKRGDLVTAEKAKEEVEERQRFDEKARLENVIEHQPKLFHQTSDGWMFNEPLRQQNAN